MEITDIGPFKKLVVPAEWQRRSLRIPQSNRMELPVIQLSLPGKEDSLEIGIFYRGKLESEDDGANFHALLEQNKESKTAVTLTPGQIRSLTRTLDLAGFNQYVFPRHLSGYNPDFQLRSAQVYVLNGRPVLRVEGEFKADLDTDTYFACLYVEADSSGRKVFELYLRASDRDTFFKGLQVFKQINESIEWAG